MAENVLNDLLEKAGIKKKPFARLAGLSDGLIYKVCNKSYTPSPTTMNQIKNTYNKKTGENLSVEDIFRTKEEK